jgi:hypothetical protein
MIGHIERAKLYWKNKYLIVSSYEQKTHILLQCQFRLIRLSLVRITPRRKYHAKILFLSGDEGMTPWVFDIGLPATAQEQDGHSKPKTN